MSSGLDQILDEQRFPYVGMSLEERNYYLNIIKHCKDICDTENIVDSQNECELVELRLKKEEDVINFSGSLTIGTDNISENRTIVGKMFLKKDCVVVIYEITRLCVDCINKVYSVVDKFELKDDKLKRKSNYSYTTKKVSVEINDEELKGKIR